MKAINGLKCCACCKQTKEVKHFSNNKQSKDGLGVYCRSCAQEKHLQWMADPAHVCKAKETQQKYWRSERGKQVSKASDFKRLYGITIDEYDTMLESQCGVCAICKQPETIAKRFHLSVDHDHTTGQVRGLLCHSCNTAVGLLRDSAASFYAAGDYLAKHSQFGVAA